MMGGKMEKKLQRSLVTMSKLVVEGNKEKGVVSGNIERVDERSLW